MDLQTDVRVLCPQVSRASRILRTGLPQLSFEVSPSSLTPTRRHSHRPSLPSRTIWPYSSRFQSTSRILRAAILSQPRVRRKRPARRSLAMTKSGFQVPSYYHLLNPASKTLSSSGLPWQLPSPPSQEQKPAIQAPAPTPTLPPIFFPLSSHTIPQRSLNTYRRPLLIQEKITRPTLGTFQPTSRVQDVANGSHSTQERRKTRPRNCILKVRRT